MKNIIIRAPIFSQSGYGEHSRDIVLSLWESQKFNISILPTQWGGSTNIIDNLPPKIREILVFMCNNKIHENVPFVFIHIGIPPEFQKIGNNFSVGITAGLEANRIPKEWVEGCNKVDLVIVPSNFEKEVFKASGVTTKVEVVEEGVDTLLFNNNSEDIDKDFYQKLDDIPTDTNLLCIGQWLPGAIGEDRKGIGLTIDTFLKAFEGNKKVGLIVKTYINNNSSVDFFYVNERIKDLKKNYNYPKITLIHGNLTNKEISTLYKHPKVVGFISLTSGEGWGRGIAEAIACDLPVAVTGWGGHMQYVNSNYAHIIDFDLKPVSKGAIISGFFTPDMIWAYPNVKDATDKMRLLINNINENREKSKKLGEIFRNNYSKEIVYQKLVQLLDNIPTFSSSHILSVEKV